MKVSFLMLTIDRYELTKSTWEKNLQNIQKPFEYELLICDNGSKDRRIVDYFGAIANYHRVNSKNEGVAKSFNQLYLRSTGDIIVLLGNDIVNPDGWLEETTKYALAVPNSGIVGIDWGHGHVPPISQKNGFFAHWLKPPLDRVFGTWIMRRRVIDEIGFFYDGFEHYGLEDSDFNERVNLAGFHSCYVPNMKSEHIGVGEHDSGEYREFKNKSMSINAGIFSKRCAKFQIEGIKCELPQKRDPT